jgi:hypothetical protein
MVAGYQSDFVEKLLAGPPQGQFPTHWLVTFLPPKGADRAQDGRMTALPVVCVSKSL